MLTRQILCAYIKSIKNYLTDNFYSNDLIYYKSVKLRFLLVLNAEMNWKLIMNIQYCINLIIVIIHNNIIQNWLNSDIGKMLGIH